MSRYQAYYHKNTKKQMEAGEELGFFRGLAEIKALAGISKKKESSTKKSKKQQK
ncbi:hypothetical protein [Alteribacillus sp. HJP-4]|uniref:hypothetical protein n=1 Tax=Alteribacillus sp. HJP-4 TaxID=2775394 RepID=UPI0035CCD8AA